ncbi:WecB/TagA/CpsF family glycosyltransferase [Photobacterium swingsii]|uniref:WecB/TagA/CpsF family glycosyltransferase n=1 Tax=Photobacterium swingsii TaxID=680026 RepID=UPI003D0BB600
MNWLDNKISTTKDFPDYIHKLYENGGAVTFVNPFSYYIVESNYHYDSCFDAIYIDGSSLVYAHNLLFKDSVKRRSFDFSSIATDVFNFSIKHNLSVAIVGATHDELLAAKINLNKIYPNLDVCYSRDGYFSSESDVLKTIKEIDSSSADILIVGMGTPYQEDFLVSYFKETSSRIMAFTCGGFLSQTSIREDYYHPLIKKLGLRWLQRAVFNKHVRRRLIFDYPKFFLKYFCKAFKK